MPVRPAGELRDLVTERARSRGSVHYLESAADPRRVSYGDLEAACGEIESRLAELGVGFGDPVLIACDDLLSYAVTFVSVIAAGRVAVPVDPAAPASELARVRAFSNPLAVAEGDGISLRPLTRVPQPVTSWPTSGGAGVFLSTSGTSGEPKGVLLQESQLLHVATAIARHHDLSSSDRGLSLLPLFHINAEVVGLLATLVAGGTLVLAERFHRTGFWELATSRNVTWINAVPAIIAILAASERPLRRLCDVRFIRSASAPLAAATLHSFEQATGIPVLESYGMTEAASMITANPLSDRRPGSVGRPVGTLLRVVGEGSGHCPPGTVGRVQIAGPGVITQYLFGGRDAFTDDGWLDTKDLGYLDSDGFLYLVGRADDVINRGGEKFYPREVEEVLSSHPDVLAAAVVAQPDPVLGARPVAFVVDRSLEDDFADALRLLCRARLSSYKVPVEFRRVEALPLGATGKVARHKLRLLAATGS